MKTTFSIFCLICIISCKSTQASFTPKNIDNKESYVVIDYQEKYKIFEKASVTDLNENEISNLKRILEDALSQYNLLKTKDIDLNKYKLQFVPVINKMGEKEVWVNGLCKQNGENWKHEIILIDDGGNCYFNLKINLSNNKYYDLIVNGEA